MSESICDLVKISGQYGAKRRTLPQCPKAFVSKAAAEKSQNGNTDLPPHDFR